jgi:hypothetical protein
MTLRVRMRVTGAGGAGKSERSCDHAIATIVDLPISPSLPAGALGCILPSKPQCVFQAHLKAYIMSTTWSSTPLTAIFLPCHARHEWKKFLRHATYHL